MSQEIMTVDETLEALEARLKAKKRIFVVERIKNSVEHPSYRERYKKPTINHDYAKVYLIKIQELPFKSNRLNLRKTISGNEPEYPVSITLHDRRAKIVEDGETYGKHRYRIKDYATEVINEVCLRVWAGSYSSLPSLRLIRPRTQQQWWRMDVKINELLIRYRDNGEKHGIKTLSEDAIRDKIRDITYDKCDDRANTLDIKISNGITDQEHIATLRFEHESPDDYRLHDRLMGKAVELYLTMEGWKKLINVIEKDYGLTNEKIVV